MDTNSGRFVEESSAERWMKRVSVGETLKIKTEEVVIVAIGPDTNRGLSDREMIVALKSATDRMLDEQESADRLELMREKMLRDQAKRGTGYIGGAPGKR